MAKRPPLDDVEPVEGPFKVPDSIFPDSEDEPPFTDADVEAIMGQGGPPRPPAPPADQQWVVEGDPTVGGYEDAYDDTIDGAHGGHEARDDDTPYAEEEDDYVAPPPRKVEYSEPESRRPTPQGDTSGLVMVVEHSDDGDDKPEAAPAADLGSSAMTYAAMGIVAMLIGMVGALVVVLVLTAGGGEPEPEPGDAQELELGKIKVRRTLKENPRPNYIEENIREFEEREANGGMDPSPEGEPTTGVPAGGTEGEIEGEEEPVDDDPTKAPIGNKLD